MKMFNMPWHQRLATYYGSLDISTRVDSKVDFCVYTNAIFKGIINVSIVMFFGGVFSWILGDFIAWLVSGYSVAPDVGAIIAIVILITAMVGVAFNVTEKYMVKPTLKYLSSSNYKNDDTPGFFKTWLYSIKNKVCVPITIKATDPYTDD